MPSRLPSVDSALLHLTRLFREHPDFEENERNYKLRVAQALTTAAEAVRAGDEDCLQRVDEALRHQDNNLQGWRIMDAMRKWVAASPTDARKALAALWTEDGPGPRRIGLFLAFLPDSVARGKGVRASLGSFLLGGVDPLAYPVYRPQVTSELQRLLGWHPADPADEAAIYADALDLYDEFAESARSAGIAVRDRLDAQSLLWCLAKWPPGADWSTDDRQQLDAIRKVMNPKGDNLGLEDAVAKWDRHAVTERVERAVNEREEFVARFPADRWPNVDLAEYALGLPQSPDGFCNWLEFKTPTAGSIKGGSAMKHLIFRRKNTGVWWFEPKYESEQQAWDAIRQGFADVVRLGRQGRWDDVESIGALVGAGAIKRKTCWMYFPDQLLPIYVSPHLEHFCRLFDVPVGGLGATAMNRRLFEKITNLPVFADWQPLEIMFFLYEWANPNPSHKILKIAPGEAAVLWDDCRRNGYIRVGWQQTGDLTQYEDAEQIAAALEQSDRGESQRTSRRAAKNLEKFRSLEEGDLIVANRGQSLVVGVGRVTGPYEFHADLDHYPHTVPVDWFDLTERKVDFGAGWRHTIVELKPAQYDDIIKTSGIPAPTQSPPLPAIPPQHLIAEKLLARTGQAIFYGPPGTGKTFAARRHAAWLLAGGSGESQAARAFGSPADLKELEDEFLVGDVVDDRPAWVLVANPSHWSWDALFRDGRVEFDYGRLPRNYDEVRVGDAVYGYEATPTKALVARARVTRALYTDDEGQRKIGIGDGRKLATPVSWETLRNDPLLGQSQPLSNRMQGTLFRLEPSEIERLEQLISGRSVDAATRKHEFPQLSKVTFHPTYAYEDFIEGYKPVEGANGLQLEARPGIFKQLCRAAAADPTKPYVLVIDEINRGNVPKIFGELITLIERDKRGLSTTLPQTGELFSVPANVHIIATMNTADRSIHVLDVALRRRFSFLEFLPEPEVLDGTEIAGVALDDLLNALNTKVRERFGRERQVGHAMFMTGDQPIKSEEDLALAIRYELLPLLQEYAYSDYRDLADVLGDAIIDVDNQTVSPDIFDNPAQLVQALGAHLGLAST